MEAMKKSVLNFTKCNSLNGFNPSRDQKMLKFVQRSFENPNDCLCKQHIICSPLLIFLIAVANP